MCPGIAVATLDGDTPYAKRPPIISSAHVILTNPDMLHCSILPQHPKFAALLRGLRFVVVDEAHMYLLIYTYQRSRTELRALNSWISHVSEQLVHTYVRVYTYGLFPYNR